MYRNPVARKPIADYLLAAMFVVTIAAPLVPTPFMAEKATSVGSTASGAGLGLKAVLTALLQHFPFKENLLAVNGWLRLSLGASPTPWVVVGRGGWLYLGYYPPERYDGLMDGSRTNPFTAEELDLWVQNIQARRDWLASRGIKYVLMIVPNKQTVYPEYLPESLRPSNGPSRFDDLVLRLRHAKVDIVDPRPDLMRAKKLFRVYYRTDSHWNQAGALVAYRALLQVLNRYYPQLHSPQLVRCPPSPPSARDLTNMLGLPGAFLESGNLVYKFDHESRITRYAWCDGYIDPIHTVPVRWVPGSIAYTENPHAPLSSLCLLADSFSDELLGPLLDEYSRKGTRVWSHVFDKGLLEERRPELVVEEIVERSLTHPPPMIH